MHFIMCLPEILASTCMHGCTELCLTFGGSLLKSASMHVWPPQSKSVGVSS